MTVRNIYIILILIIISSGIMLSCSKEEKPELKVHLSLKDMHFGYFEDSKTFTIKNVGVVDVEWQLDFASEYFSSNKSSGRIKPGIIENIVVSVNRANMISQQYHSIISISADGNELLNVPVSADHYNNPYLLAHGDLINALYDRNFDRIVMVFDNPPEIIRLDPVTMEIESLELVLPPQAISISTDGRFAAIGHNGWFTYLNLVNMETVRVYPIAIDIHNLVLAPNNWVYTTSVDNHLLRCVSLETGNETTATGAGFFNTPSAPVKLHPSGDYLYSVSTHNPSGLLKYSITEGTASYLYSYPYHGVYEPGRDLWVCDEGKRIFTQGKRLIFNATNQQETDMTYSGQLEGQYRIINLDHNSKSGRVYAIQESDLWSNTPDTIIWQYEDKYMNHIGSFPVPRYLVADSQGNPGFINARAYYIFFSSDGTQFYVLQKPVETPLLEDRWALGMGLVD